MMAQAILAETILAQASETSGCVHGARARAGLQGFWRRGVTFGCCSGILYRGFSFFVFEFRIRGASNYEFSFRFEPSGPGIFFSTNFEPSGPRINFLLTHWRLTGISRGNFCNRRFLF